MREVLDQDFCNNKVDQLKGQKLDLNQLTGYSVPEYWFESYTTHQSGLAIAGSFFYLGG